MKNEREHDRKRIYSSELKLATLDDLTFLGFREILSAELTIKTARCLMVTMDEIRAYLNKKYKRELTFEEIAAILNGTGLMTIDKVIKETKEEQKRAYLSVKGMS